VAIVRTLPPWKPPNPVLATRAYQGHLRVVIDETGRVESATLLRSFLPQYETQLLDAARRWRFRPATKEGVPVKFVRVFTIDVAAR
jgi:TonB family protein